MACRTLDFGELGSADLTEASRVARPQASGLARSASYAARFRAAWGWASNQTSGSSSIMRSPGVVGSRHNSSAR